MYFHFRLLGRENKLKILSIPPPLPKKYGGENKHLNICSFILGPCPRGKENIFQAVTCCLAHFPIGIYGQLSLYQYSEMTVAPQKGETSYNMLTMYPIQSIHCGIGVLMMYILWPRSRI